MSTPPTPSNEAERLAALERYGLLDSAPDPAYDAFTRLAAEICGTHVSLVSLIDSTRQWFKSNTGLPGITQTPREQAFCTHAMATNEFFEIRDASIDPRFAENPLVVGEPNIRFYAGVPLVDRDGFALGTLCTFDDKPQRLSEEQRYALRRLAASLVALIESRKNVPQRSLEQLAAFNSAFEFSADPIAVLRVSEHGGIATISYVNPSFGDLFGYDPTSLIGSGLHELQGPKTDLVKMARLRSAAQAFEPGTETTFLYASSGTARFVELRERVVDVAHRILSVRDLTRVQQTQEVLSDTNARLQSLIANNSDAVLTLDRHGQCIDSNPAASQIFGYERAELKGTGFLRAVRGTVFPGDGQFPEDLVRGQTMALRTTYRTRDDRPLEMDVKVIPMIVRGRTEGAYLVLKDVTEAVRLEKLTRELALRTRSLYLISANHDTSGPEQIDLALRLVLEALDMQYAYVGKIDGRDFVIENVVGSGSREVGEILPLAQTRVSEALALGDVLAVDDISTQQAPAAVRTYDYRAYIAAPLTIEGTAYGAIGFLAHRVIAFDSFDKDFIRLVASLVATVIERQLQKKRMDELAYFDGLTGLPNRVKLMSELASSVARAGRHGGSFAVHFADLDGFKSVNDRAGHATGDVVLAEAARRLRALHRPCDLPARFGGDEFVLVQSEAVTRESAFGLAQRMVDTLSEPYETDAGPMLIGASVGVAFFPDDADSVEHLLQAADAALYRAKANGKRRVVFFADREPSIHA